MSDIKHWAVLSPIMAEVVPVLDDGSGPIEEWREVVYAEAETKRDAIEVGVKVMSEWPRYARRDQLNPFAGVEAESVECEHGFCWCEFPDCKRGHAANGHGDYCEACYALHT